MLTDHLKNLKVHESMGPNGIHALVLRELLCILFKRPQQSLMYQSECDWLVPLNVSKIK